MVERTIGAVLQTGGREAWQTGHMLVQQPPPMANLCLKISPRIDSLR